MIHYFAYGSNMSEERFTDRRIISHVRQKGILKDYELVFNKKSYNKDLVYANIEYKEGEEIEGILYEIDEKDLKRLDKFEAYPKQYNRKLMDIITNEGKVPAWVYIAQKEWVVEGLKPTKEYMDYLLDGKEFLSEEYFEKLKKIEESI